MKTRQKSDIIIIEDERGTKMLPSFRFQFLSLVLLLTTPASSRLSQARVSGRGNNAAVVQRQRQGTCSSNSVGEGSPSRRLVVSSNLTLGTKNPSSEGSNPSCRTRGLGIPPHTFKIYHLLYVSKNRQSCVDCLFLHFF